MSPLALNINVRRGTNKRHNPAKASVGQTDLYYMTFDVYR